MTKENEEQAKGDPSGVRQREVAEDEGEPRPPHLTQVVIRSLHDQGLTDGEMADRTGTDLPAVRAIREAMELPAHTRLSTDRRRRALPIDGRDDAYQMYYDEKLPDAEIARRVGVTRSAVYEWRQARRLPAHKARPSTESCWRYYVRGFTDREIAALTGVKEASVAHWRYRYDLPAVTRYRMEETAEGTRPVGKGVPDYRKYYDQGWNDAEIAAAVNRTQSAVQSWRRKHGLPPRAERGRPYQAETHVPTEQRAAQRIVVPVVERPPHPVRRPKQRATDDGGMQRTG